MTDMFAADGHEVPELDPALLAAYLATEVVDTSGLVLSGAGALLEFAPTWVVTAENPFSQSRDHGTNNAAMAQLEQTVRAAGLVAVRLEGRAPDRSWSERCWGVQGATRGVVCSWGRAHSQHAVFLLTETEHVVVSCWTGEILARRPRVLDVV